eukprot:4942974-Prymnesium_polylepis.1
MKPYACEATVSTSASVLSERRMLLNAMWFGVLTVTLRKGEPALLVHGSISMHAADGEHDAAAPLTSNQRRFMGLHDRAPRSGICPPHKRGCGAQEMDARRERLMGGHRG